MSYFENLSVEGKGALVQEFEDKATSRERRIEILTLLQDGANEAKLGPQCPECKNYPFFAPHSEALIGGHVYSRMGMDEIWITGYCEFCFDLITAEPEGEEYTK